MKIFRTFHRAIHGILTPFTSYPGFFDFLRTKSAESAEVRATPRSNYESLAKDC